MEQLTYEQKKQAARAKTEREEAEVKALFPELVKQIAAAMGYTARFTNKHGEPFYRCTAVLEQGTRGIHVSTQDYSPNFRLSISGDYDMGPSELSIGWPHGTPRPSITVSMRRSAAAIAKEINSRFLPDYDAACTKIAESVKRVTADRDARRATADRLAAIAKVELKKDHHTGELPLAFFKYYGAAPYTGPKLEVKCSNGSATIEFDCGVELAAAVIQAIEALAKQRTPAHYGITRTLWTDECGLDHGGVCNCAEAREKSNWHTSRPAAR